MVTSLNFHFSVALGIFKDIDGFFLINFKVFIKVKAMLIDHFLLSKTDKHSRKKGNTLRACALFSLYS